MGDAGGVAWGGRASVVRWPLVERIPDAAAEGGTGGGAAAGGADERSGGCEVGSDPWDEPEWHEPEWHEEV